MSVKRMIIEVASDDCITVWKDDGPPCGDNPIPFEVTMNGVHIKVDFGGNWVFIVTTQEADMWTAP